MSLKDPAVTDKRAAALAFQNLKFCSGPTGKIGHSILEDVVLQAFDPALIDLRN